MKAIEYLLITTLSCAVAVSCADSPEQPKVAAEPTATAQPATSLAFTLQPADSYAGSEISPAVEVTVMADGNVPARGFSGDITLSINETYAGALGGDSTVRAVNGRARFTNLSILRAGRVVLRASAAGLRGYSAPFDVITPPRLSFSTCFGEGPPFDDGCAAAGIVTFTSSGDMVALPTPRSSFSSAPAWSPDGARIAVAGSRECRSLVESCVTDIYLLDARSGDELRLTHGEYGTVAFPSWSPDRKIAFSSQSIDDSGVAERIYTMNADGSNVTPLGNLRGTGITWSPDGRSLAFSGGTQDGHRAIWIADADGSRPVRLTLSDGDDAFPSWSPDGRAIVFTRTRPRAGAMRECQLLVVRIDGEVLAQLTQDLSCATAPAWSPEGDQIAYYGSDALGQRWLMVMNPDGTGRKKLRRSTAAESRPAWVPK